MMPLNLSIYGMARIAFVLVTLTFALVADAQTTVREKVTDDRGETIPLASVYLKDQVTTGTTTDFDGNYSIKIPGGTQTIVFS